MALFDSLIEFLGSGLIVAASDTLILEAQDGPLKLSSHGGSGVLDYDQGSGWWRLKNGANIQPIMSGINGVSGPSITLIGGTNVGVTPNPSNNTITIDASGSTGIQTINGSSGPHISVVGASGIQVATSGSTLEIAHNVVGYRAVVPGFVGNQIFTHNLGTTFVVPSFRATSGGGNVVDSVFAPQRVKILNANQIGVRMTSNIDFEMTLIAYKG